MITRKPFDLENITNNSKGKKLSVLIDPDKHTDLSLKKLIDESEKACIDFFLIGGSLLFCPIEEAISKIKSETEIPLILFPGNLMQLTPSIDAMLLLSLISGRNPELLIGNHVIAAPIIKKYKIPTVSTGYMLIGTGKSTSVEYVSATFPIPSDKSDIASATAMAGELLGFKLIYMDAGSGADLPVPEIMIHEVKKSISIPLMVGGGIRTQDQLFKVCAAGADIIIVGNIIEKEPDLLSSFVKIVREF